MAYYPSYPGYLFDVAAPASNTAAVITYPNPTNDIQSLLISGTASGGSFTLSFGGQVTTTISNTASAATIQSDLQALSSIGSNNILCFGGPLPVAVYMVFSGALAGSLQSLITVNTNSLTGTNPLPVISRILAGGASSYNHCISGIVWSYNVTPTAGNLQIQDGSAVILNMDITTSGAGFIPFNPAKEGTNNNPMTITLGAGGSGVSGKLTILGHWLRNSTPE